jgi:hypothetical protein
MIGYGEDDSESDQDEDDVDDPSGFIKEARLLLQASKLALYRCQHPKVKIIFPRLRLHELGKVKLCNPKLVLKVFERMKAMGITVQLAHELPDQQNIEDVVPRMVAPDYTDISETLNLDTTILLALVSDISNGQVESQDWHHEYISVQIKLEKCTRLLPDHIWPIICKRQLVCTQEAYDTMQLIVDTIGTETEKHRAALLFAQLGATLKSSERIPAFQALCDYAVPKTWSLPIKVVDIDFQGTLQPEVLYH